MKRKETIYRGLDLINVFFEDTSLTSPDIFQITEFPTRLTAGKNLIKLKGHPDNLRIGSYLNIEILDFNGDPIYYEIIDYIDEDKSRVIAIYVYEETSPGEASITIVGELQQLNGQPVPQEWEGRANVKWSRTVQINPTLSNNSEVIFEALPNVTIQEQVGVQLNRTYPNGQQFPTYSTGTVRFFSYNGQPAIELTNGLFTKDMEDGTITVSSPSNPQPTPQFTPSSTAYSSTIKKVLSETTMLLDSEFIVKSNQTLSTHTYTSFDASSYSLLYEATPTYTPTENSESFAYVTINGLEPATGDIDRIKVFVNGKGTIGTWEQINDIELEEIELFVDTGSVFPDFAIGTFSSQNIIDTYWEAKYFNNGGLGTAPTASWTSGSIGNGVQIIPHGGSDISATNSVMTFQHVAPYAATFVSQSAYKLTIDAIGTRSSVSGNSNPKLSIFLSGSAFPYDAQDLLNQNIQQFGRRIGELEVLSSNQRFDDTVFEFEALQNGSGQLIFVIEGGEWQFSDIRTTTDNDPGYTPGYTRIRTEIPTKHKSGNQLSFKLEYYNVDSVKSKQISYVNNLDWQGGNRYIDGDYSMLTGSLYVADSLESGIAISGLKNTGFVRSLGYSGFEYGDPGFLLWSGSALSGSSGTKGGVPYSGVGLELYASGNNYFRFSTADSELDVRTEKFFVGNSSTNISASNGNLQILSSNFTVTADGDVSATNISLSGTSYAGLFSWDIKLFRDEGEYPALSAIDNDVLWYTSSYGGVPYVIIDLGAAPASFIRFNDAPPYPIWAILINDTSITPSRQDGTLLTLEAATNNVYIRAGNGMSVLPATASYITPFGTEYNNLNQNYEFYYVQGQRKFEYNTTVTIDSQSYSNVYDMDTGARIFLQKSIFDYNILATGHPGYESFKGVFPAADDLYDIGSSSRRWDDIYATNATIQTSDETQKTDIASSDLGLDFINELQPVSYKWIGKTRTHYGLIAQSVSSSLANFNKTTADFAGIVISTNESGSIFGLRYNEFISPLIKAIQEQQQIINSLQSRIEILESGSV